MAFLEADLCKKIISVTQSLKLNPEKPNKREYTVITLWRVGFFGSNMFLLVGPKSTRNQRKPAETNEIVNCPMMNRTFRFMQT